MIRLVVLRREKSVVWCKTPNAILQHRSPAAILVSPVSSALFPLIDNLAILSVLLCLLFPGGFHSTYRATRQHHVLLDQSSNMNFAPSRPEGTRLLGVWLGKIRFPVSILHFIFQFAFCICSQCFHFIFGDQFTCIYNIQFRSQLKYRNGMRCASV